MVAVKRTKLKLETFEPEFVVDGDTVAPRTKEQRYRIYRVKNGGRPDLVATCRTQGEIGTVVVKLGAKGEFDDHVLGIMDGRDHKDENGKWIGKWLVRPWVTGGPSRKELRDAGQDRTN